MLNLLPTSKMSDLSEKILVERALELEQLYPTKVEHKRLLKGMLLAATKKVTRLDNITFKVSGNADEYTVILKQNHPIPCTCPDTAKAENPFLCKHRIAALLTAGWKIVPDKAEPTPAPVKPSEMIKPREGAEIAQRAAAEQAALNDPEWIAHQAAQAERRAALDAKIHAEAEALTAQKRAEMAALKAQVSEEHAKEDHAFFNQHLAPKRKPASERTEAEILAALGF